MSVREKYSLYDNKAYILEMKHAEYRKCIEERINKAGFEVEYYKRR